MGATEQLIRPVRALSTGNSDNQVMLTAREQDCLLWAIEGKSSWEISMILNLSERTVNFHFNNILNKTNSVNRCQAIAKCILNNLIAS